MTELNEGDRVRFTLSNLGAIREGYGRPTNTVVGRGDEGTYLWPHPELEDWHLIKITDKDGLLEWVPAHESMFELVEPEFVPNESGDQEKYLPSADIGQSDSHGSR